MRKPLQMQLKCGNHVVTMIDSVFKLSLLIIAMLRYINVKVQCHFFFYRYEKFLCLHLIFYKRRQEFSFSGFPKYSAHAIFKLQRL